MPFQDKVWRKRNQSKITAGIRRAFRDPKVQAKRDKAIRKAMNTPEHKKKQSQIAKSLWENPAYRRRQKKAMARVHKYKHVRLARAKNGRKVLRRLWRNPDFVKKIHHSRTRVSKPHLSIFKAISGSGIKGHKLEYCIGKFCLDIAFPKKKLAIEVDGKYWHKEVHSGKADRRKNRLLRKRGWKLLRISAENYKEERKRVVNWVQSCSL